MYLRASASGLEKNLFEVLFLSFSVSFELSLGEEELSLPVELIEVLHRSKCYYSFTQNTARYPQSPIQITPVPAPLFSLPPEAHLPSIADHDPRCPVPPLLIATLLLLPSTEVDVLAVVPHLHVVSLLSLL